MRVIGDRISILKKEDLLSIVILPTTDKRKLGVMFLWLLAWTVCGVVVFVNYFKVAQQEARVFIIVYLSFWAYYEYKIMRAFIWKKWGKEKIWIQGGILHYKKDVNGRGRVNEFSLDLVNRIRLVEVSHRNFGDFINQSFWIKGGERIEFDFMSKNIRFAMQLSDEEARAVLAELKANLH